MQRASACGNSPIWTKPDYGRAGKRSKRVTHHPKWGRVAAISGIMAVIVGIPTAIVGIRDLAASRRTSTPHTGMRTPGGGSGSLSSELSVTLEGGHGRWQSEWRGAPGQIVDWRLLVSNQTTEKRYENVVMRVALAPHLSVVPGSVRLVNAMSEIPLPDSPLFGGGFDNGAYEPDDNSLVFFATRLESDFGGCSVETRSTAYVSANGVTRASTKSHAEVAIGRPC
jgi:hypothetical protein